MLVENSGYGATYAAPIASLLMEYYINRNIPEKRKPLEERMFSANLMDNTKPAQKGTPTNDPDENAIKTKQVDTLIIR